MPLMTPSHRLDEPRIVGIGASAGGLEALEQLFGCLPQDTGLAFVVIQHLSPDFKSLMTELLARRTRMNIKRVDDAAEILPNHVYLIPPKKLLELNDGKIVTAEFEHAASPPRAIDHFFLSLAKAQGKSAIGVILSGTGTDGTAGSAAIREVGGTIVAQDPDTCKFDGMPSSVIRKGLAQECLSPEDIAQYLVNLSGSGVNDSTRNNIFADKRHLLVELFSLLEESEGIDFKHYRTTTLTRRIERRMQTGKFASLEDYIERVRADAAERLELQNEFLIGVTRFFRDEDAFEELRNKVIPEIVDPNEGQTIRVWVAGCSTGEEAISLAILFYDYIRLRGKHCDVKIFATDVDRKAIEYASIAKYSESQVIDLPPEAKRDHFTQSGDSYELRPHIRRMIIYSHHNVIKDPPFTKLDFLSCRNLLIYFQSALQDRCISLFLFALKQKGVLFLGKSEALGDLSSEFDTINSVHKIFRKHSESAPAVIGDVRQPLRTLHSLTGRHQRLSSPYSPSSLVRESQISRAYELLLDQYVPPCLLMDDKDQLIHVFGSAGDLLRIPPGKTTLDVMKLLPKEFSLALRSASTLAASSLNEVVMRDVEGAPLDPDKPMGAKRLYTLRVKPLDWHDSKSSRPMLVFFADQSEASPSLSLPASAEPPKAIVSYQWNQQTQEHIQSLEDHLKSTRETLQTAIEELETTNEELQSTNEELMSSNEELQSSNEELHSVNEELYTVNTEYQNKIEELSRANLDIDFLLKTSRIGVIFLGHDLKVRRFNENVRDMISLMPHDVGRPITDLRFNYANREIIDGVQKVASGGPMMQFEMPSRGGAQLVTISRNTSQTDGPYIADSGSKEPGNFGIVISFVDITPSKMSEVIRQKHSFADSMLGSFLTEMRHLLHVVPSAGDVQLPDLKRKLFLLEQMVIRVSERRRLNQNPEHTDILSSAEVCRRVAEAVPGSERITIRGRLPQVVVPAELFEDTMMILWQTMARYTASRKVSFTVESVLEEGFCCFDFCCEGQGLDDSDLRGLFSISESPLGTEPLVDAGLGMARLNAELMGGELAVLPAGPANLFSCLRLALPGVSHPTYPEKAQKAPLPEGPAGERGRPQDSF